MYRLTTYLAIVLLLGLPQLLAAQADEPVTPQQRYLERPLRERQLDRERWLNLTKDIDYSEKKRTRQSRPDRRQDSGNGSGRNIDPLFGEGALSAIARFLLILIGAVLIAWLVRNILGYGRVKDKKIERISDRIDVQQIEENLHETAFDELIRRAVAAADYNLAVRLYYLAILKELSLQRVIKWKVDKTNLEYIREMRGHELSGEFTDLTRVFERSWYGDRPLDAPAFDSLEPEFRRFLTLASRPAKAVAP